MNSHRIFSAAVAFGLVVLSVRAGAQEFKVQGNSASEDVILSTNSGTALQDRKGVHGVSKPGPYWGLGGLFEGGFMGVEGIATMTGGGSRYGGRFIVGGGATNYGVYATAPMIAGSYAGYFEGNLFVTGAVTQGSDFNLKTNLQDVPDGTLAQVLLLRPKTYRYVASSSMHLKFPASEQVGLVAQDVAQIFPNLVHEITVPAEEKGKPVEKFLSVDYIKVIPLLVKALQEQQVQIDALRAQINVAGKR